MSLIGKVKHFVKKVGKINPKAILQKVGKVAHTIIGGADKVLGTMESIGNKIAKIPVVGDTLKGIYKAPIFKGVSPEMIFQGAKTGVGIAKKIDSKAQAFIDKVPEGDLASIVGRKFSTKSVANIGNKHLVGQRTNASLINNIISSASSHPAVRSRVRGLTNHLQAKTIMKATPLSQVSNVVKHHTTRVINSSLG